MDYARDGAVTMLYIFALILEYLLPLLLKAIGHSALSHSLIPKSIFTLYFSASHDDIGENHISQFSLVKTGIFQMLELEFILSNNIVLRFLQISKKIR